MRRLLTVVVAVLALHASPAAADVLHDQLANDVQGHAWLVTHEDPDGGFFHVIADDFEVPAGETWTIDLVETGGTFEDGLPLRIRLYDDDGGRPGAPVFEASGPTDVPAFGEVNVAVAGAPALGPGRYWLSLQSFATIDGFSWGVREGITGEVSHYRSSTGSCSDWTPLGPCLGYDDYELDQRFRLSGTRGEVAPCPPALQPVGCWTLGEIAGTTASDASGLGSHGAYGGGPLLGVPGATAFDTAVRFDGVNDHLVVPDSPTLDVGDSFTLEAWIRRDGDDTTEQLFNKGADGLHLVVMDRHNGNQVWLRKANDSTLARSAGGVPADGAYHHVVVTRNGPGSTRIFIDGVEQAVTHLAPAKAIQDTSFRLFASAMSGSGAVDGDLDDLALYDRPLTEAEVADRFARGAAQRLSALRAGGDGADDDRGGCAPPRVVELRREGVTCAESRRLLGGGPAALEAAGFDCAVTDERFSLATVRIARTCRRDAARLSYTAVS